MESGNRRINPLLLVLLGGLGAFWVWQQFGPTAGVFATALAAMGLIALLVCQHESIQRGAANAWRFFVQRRRLLALGSAAVTASVIGLFAIEVRRAQRQQDIIARAERIEGHVTYDYQIGRDGSLVPDARHPAPAILQRIFSPGIFVHAVELSFPTRVVGDKEVAVLRDFSDLRRLYLGGARITDASVDHLETLTGLEELHIVGTQVSASGIDRLTKKLPGCSIHHQLSAASRISSRAK